MNITFYAKNYALYTSPFARGAQYISWRRKYEETWFLIKDKLSCPKLNSDYPNDEDGWQHYGDQYDD